MNRPVILFFLVFSLPLLPNCKKEPEKKPELPPITSEGKNTFGCLINGEVFAMPFDNSSVKCYYYYRSFEPGLYGTFSLEGKENPSGNQSKYLGILIDTAVYDTGTYSIGFKKFSGKGETGYIARDGSTKYYYCLEGIYGWLHISCLDTLNKIVAGTFELDVVNENNNADTIRIRQGRFDSKFIY